MKELFFLRHANREDQSRPKMANPHLSQLGLSQAAFTSLKIKSTSQILTQNTSNPQVFIHSSPYQRCIETSQIVSEHLSSGSRIPINIDHAISEWLYPSITSYPQSVFALANPNNNTNAQWDSTILGSYNDLGLSYKSYHKKIQNYLLNLISFYEKYDDCVIVIITHGITINLMLQFFIHRSIFMEIPECGLNFATYNYDIKSFELKDNCLGLENGILNLENDITYYTSGFRNNALTHRNSNSTSTQATGPTTASDAEAKSLSSDKENEGVAESESAKFTRKVSSPQTNKAQESAEKSYQQIYGPTFPDSKIDLYGFQKRVDEDTGLHWLGSNR